MLFFDRKGNRVSKPEGRRVAKRRSAYGVAIAGENALMIKAAWNAVWEFPGGAVEENETLHEALKREFIEETGYELVTISTQPFFRLKRGFYAEDIDRYFDSQMSFFLVDVSEGDQPHKANRNEISEVSWVPISSLNKTSCHPISLGVVKELMDSKQ
ncbi:NUDIX hydrolase [Candidatus Micrarchaeota archaeon]|nr:NUDIX hydrolase [Candidatus Micrarchaeota archaeon]